MIPGNARERALLALGAHLAVRRGLSAVALVVTGLSGVVVAVLAVARGGARAPWIPGLASSAIAWGGGLMLAFGASLRAIPRDREEGIRELARARGAELAAYVRGRAFGLVGVLAAAVSSATFLACAAALAATGERAAVARSTAGALAYALAFAATMGPVTMAALGARTRVVGYLTLAVILTLPEVLAPWSARLLPKGWHELTSIPAALAAIRAGVAHPILAGPHAARAAAALTAVVMLALLAVAARARDSGRHDQD